MMIEMQLHTSLMLIAFGFCIASCFGLLQQKQRIPQSTSTLLRTCHPPQFQQQLGFKAISLPIINQRQYKQNHGISTCVLHYTILGGLPEESDEKSNNNGNSNKEESYHTEYIAPLQVTLKLKTQTHETDGSVSMPGTPWGASTLMAHYIALSASQTQLDWNEKTVVELGSGIGTCAIVSAMMGARVVATDASSTSLGLIRSNAETYQDACAYPITAVPLLWGDQQSLAILVEEVPPIDILMASDVVYFQSFRASLQDTIETLCQSSSSSSYNSKPPPTVLLAHTWRVDPENEEASFDSLLRTTTSTRTCSDSGDVVTYSYCKKEVDASLFPEGYNRRGADGRLPVSIFEYTPTPII